MTRKTIKPKDESKEIRHIKLIIDWKNGDSFETDRYSRPGIRKIWEAINWILEEDK